MFEQSAGLPHRRARRSPRAGRDPAEPAFVAYGLGDGLVIRSGTPQWARELSESRLSVEVPARDEPHLAPAGAAEAQPEPVAILRRVTQTPLLIGGALVAARRSAGAVGVYAYNERTSPSRSAAPRPRSS